MPCLDEDWEEVEEILGRVQEMGPGGQVLAERVVRERIERLGRGVSRDNDYLGENRWLTIRSRYANPVGKRLGLRGTRHA